MSTFPNTDEPTWEMLEMYRLHRCCGIPQTKVATQFGISQSTVSKSMTKVEEWQRGQFREEVALFRTRFTSRLEHLYGEALQTWEVSKAPQVVTTTKAEQAEQSDGQRHGDEGSGQETKVTTTRETSQTGNPAFLRIAMDSLNQIQNLWSGEMVASERRGEYRSVGKTQMQLVEDKIKQLQELRESLVSKS